MKERISGFILMTAIVPLAIIGYFMLVVIGFFGRAERGRAGVRALDHFVNATVFNGIAWESVSSHAWREREKRWAKVIIWITNQFHEDHCMKSNKREQKIVDLVIKKNLHQQTIK